MIHNVYETVDVVHFAFFEGNSLRFALTITGEVSLTKGHDNSAPRTGSDCELLGAVSWIVRRRRAPGGITVQNN